MKQKLNEADCLYSIGIYPRLIILVEEIMQKENTLPKTGFIYFFLHLERDRVDGCIEMLHYIDTLLIYNLARIFESG